MKNFLWKSFKTGIWLILFFVLLIAAVLLVAPGLRPGAATAKSVFALNEQDNYLRPLGFDWEAPLVSLRDPDREIRFQSTEVSIITNELVDLVDTPAGWELMLISSQPDSQKHFYLLLTNQIPAGKHEYTLTFQDEALNQTFARLQINAPANRLTAPNWEDPKYYMPADSLLAIANKQYRLPQDFAPDDLVPLSKHGINFANNAHVRQPALLELKRMTDAITSAGINYTVTSAYRSYQDQFNAYSYWLDYNDGDIAATDAVSARPGHSEHQLGTTVDFVTSENGGIFYQFENTRLSRWLADNAWKYGFTISYPRGKEDVTGYSYEPWHYRFVGKANAKLIRQSGLTLTEWLLEANAGVLQQ